jgi:transcriptional regulator with XRE-family HTH domain
MQFMVSITESVIALRSLGARLRDQRLARGISQRMLADQFGVSLPTIRAMEVGAPTVAIGHWVNALWALDKLEDLEQVLKQGETVFARAAAVEVQRKRAPRRVQRRG